MVDTQDPEHRFRPARSPGNGRFREMPVVVVLSGVAFGLTVVAFDHFKRGSVLIAASVLLAAILRLLLPDHRAGLLASRSRTLDVLVLGFLGIGLAVTAVVVPPPS